jgi:prepilin-type N-terminal cleavage/methylation domain-containing protein
MRRIEGVTLPELILVIVILGLLAAFVGPVLYNSMRAYERLEQSSVTQGKMRYAMERLSREIREMRRNATNTAGLDITTMTQSTLAFYKTDGTQVTVSRTSSVVNLFYSNPTFFSTLTGGLLVDQVNGFSFAYFQPNASATATTAGGSSLAFIQISVSLTEVTGTNIFGVRTRVNIRGPR